MTPPTTPSLDHLILFLPIDPSTSHPLTPEFFTQNFTLKPGGTHADNLTTNTLILLADGCYIELISFLPATSTPAIADHWWGPTIHRKGWTDWCLTTTTTSSSSSSPALTNFARLQKGGKGPTYAPPRAGARLRPDGVEVKWAVTFPSGEKGGQTVRGRLPFFCHDDPGEARGLRVPVDGENARHKCGVLGVRCLTVLVRDRGLLDVTKTAYAGVFGYEGVESEGGGEVVFEAGRVIDVEGLEGNGARIVLRVAEGGVEEDRVRDRGFWYGDVVFAAETKDSSELGTRERIDGGEQGDDVGGVWIEYVVLL